MATAKTQEYAWAQVFIELALRAMRRVHYEYGIWNVGAARRLSGTNVGNFNRSRGIELANEVTVCL